MEKTQQDEEKMKALIKKINSMIEMEELEPVKDAAGVYCPQGMDAVIRIKAYKDCLRWIGEIKNGS